MLKNNKKAVVVGMSGGVDSSVAAALLKQQGYFVIGVFLKFWSPPKAQICADKHTNSCRLSENSCCNMESLRQAREVANQLDIPFYVFDVSAKFKKEIVDYYLDEYKNGRTPNPCVKCNKLIKFGWLREKANQLGAEYVATGHYARVVSELKNQKSKIKIITKNLKLLKARDRNKDQSYFLWQLSQNQLGHILFPIGDYKKSEIRQLAQKLHLSVASKKDSQDICFIPNNKNAEFLKYYLSKSCKPGDIVDRSGTKLGQHRGLYCYTIGQRHDLNNIQIKDNNNRFVPAYVIKIDAKNNRIVVGAESDLYQKKLIASNINWINPTYPLFADPRLADSLRLTTYGFIRCRAKIRYGSKAAECLLKLGKNKKIDIIFKDTQRAITSGQSIVFYKTKELIGGAIIE